MSKKTPKPEGENAKAAEEEAANGGEWTSIGISVEARDKLKAICDKRNGANVREVSSALVLWFFRQKPMLQTAILDSVDAGAEMFYAESLRQIAKALEKRAGIVRPDGRHSAYGAGEKPNQSDPPQGPSANESNEDRGPTQ